MRPSLALVDYVILAISLCLGTLSTALASPLYSLYILDWHITTTQIGYAFIAYMFGVVFTLMFFNHLTLKYGFKKIVISGLVLIVLGLIYSALAQNIVELSLARFMLGVASGFINTATIVGLNLNYPFQNKMNSAKISSIITVFGFALGPIIGGIIADNTQFPLKTPYYIISLASTITLIFCFFIREKNNLETNNISLKYWNYPKIKSNKNLFLVSSLSAFCCFSIFSLYAALAGTFLSNLSLEKNATFTGLSISIILLISAITQLSSKKMQEFFSLKFGLKLITIGCFLLILSLVTHNIKYLTCSILFIGIGHGLALAPSYYFIEKIVNHETSSIFSTFLLISYQGTIWPILITSYLFDKIGNIYALTIFSLFILAIVIFLLHLIKKTGLKA
ncbi:MFS transporter [Acinetobacter sp. ANC 4173]|nr:MFS transporter [Acinetobacter sp. ANC 4173]